MADDFRIKIDSDLDLSKAESKINSFLSKYNGKEKIKLDVELDTNVLKNATQKFEAIGKSASSSFKKGFESSNSMSISSFTKTKKDILKQVNDAQKEISKITGSNYNKKTINESVVNQWANEYTRAQQNAIKKAQSNAAKELEKINSMQQKFKNQSSDLDLLKSAVKDGGTQKYGKAGYEKLTSQINAAETAAQRLNAELKNGENANLDKLNAGMKEFASLANKAAREQNKLSENVPINKQISALKDLEKHWKANTAAHKDYEGIYESYKSVLSGGQLTYGQFEDVSFGIKNMKKDIEIAGKSGRSFREEITRGFKQIGQFAATYGILQSVPDLIFNSVSELKEMDDILIEISKTSDLTSSQLKQLGKDSFENASKYGKTANEYLLGVQEMSRSGFYGKQGEELAQLSILGQAAGDMSADVSNAYLLATNAAYGYQGSVEKLNSVLDGQNMITNRNSVSMLDMAEATTQAGSMAAQSGVQVNELSALIGTAVARTKKSGNEIGTALKALFINLQNTNNKKVVGTFDDLGISMTKMVGDSEMLKTPIELLKELSTVYNTLPDGSKQKADILTNIGQKHHANVLSAVLSGYSDYEKMLSDYSQGMGSAAVEAQKSADGWSGSVNKLSNAWTSFIGNFANTDVIIGATNALTGFVNVLNTLTSNPILAGGTVGAIGGGIAFFKNLDRPEIMGFA